MIHFFLDIDLTISETLVQQLTSIKPSTILNREYGDYPLELVESIGFQNLLYPGAKELIQYLQQVDNASFSYFSAGTKERNDALVANLHAKLEDTTIPRILSKEDITPERVQLIDGRVVDTYPKAIQNFVPKKEIKNTILIDDNMFSIPQGRRRNLLYVPGGNFDLLSITCYRPEQDELYKKTDAFQINNKVFYVAGLIVSSLELRASTKNFTRALRKAVSEFKDLSDRTHYERGLNILRQFNPSLNFFMPSTLGLPLSKKIIQPQAVRPLVAPIPQKSSQAPRFYELFGLNKNNQEHEQSQLDLAPEIERSNTPSLFFSTHKKGPGYNASKEVKAPIVSSSHSFTGVPSLTLTEIEISNQELVDEWFDVPEWVPPSPRSQDPQGDVQELEQMLAELSFSGEKKTKNSI